MAFLNLYINHRVYYLSFINVIVDDQGYYLLNNFFAPLFFIVLILFLIENRKIKIIVLLFIWQIISAVIFTLIVEINPIFTPTKTLIQLFNFLAPYLVMRYLWKVVYYLFC